jgi:ATP-dependent Clp protease ATP-binding subunit ClpB
MDMNRMTIKLQEALQTASAHAMRRSHQGMDVEHLLLAFLEQEGGIVPALCEQAGVSVPAVRQAAEQALSKLPQVQGTGGGPGQLHLTSRLNQVLTKAEDEQRALKDDYLSVEHVLLAMVHEGGIFKKLGLSKDKLLAALQQVRGHQRVTSQDPEGTYQSLETYGRDLTKLAGQGKLDPVIGRDDEIRRVCPVGQKIIPSSLESPASAKQPSSKGSPSGS